MSTATSVPDVDLSPGRPAVLAADPAQGAVAWAEQNRAALRGLVTEHGAVLVRGLGLADAGVAGDVIARLGSGPVAEREPFAPRTRIADGLYSATTWPAGQTMCAHHEQSYAAEFPGLMHFACLVAPSAGGATTVVDAADVLDALPADLVARVESEGWQLVRSYNDEIGASWQDAFGTTDRSAVERYCHDNAIECAWTTDGGLRTRQRRAGVVTHPASGRRVWFNQLAFLSEWTMDPEVREFLVEEYGQDGLPFTTCFGDGEPIPSDVFDTIDGVYTAHTRREPWVAGDLLVVDNVRTAHAREAFEGPREVVVGMTDPTPAVTR